MDFDDTPDEAAFRAEVVRWLSSVAERRGSGDGASRRFRAKTEADDEAYVAEAKAWQRTVADAGYAAVHWPVEHGGRGLSAHFAGIVEQERGRFDVPANAFMVGVDMAGPTLMAHGSPDQQARWLPGTLRGEVVWCQLFSEPGAGSDLAALSTRAVRATSDTGGSGWRVTGQKVWTSGGHYADVGMLLARTDPDVPKHEGITYFVCDMHAPGVTVRPLRQIDGAIHFNEVFLDDVWVPDDAVVGPVGEGWKVARTTLTAERSAIGGGGGMSRFDDVLRLARDLGATGDPHLRQELVRLHTRTQLQRWLVYRVRTAVVQGRPPGAEASILKLLNCHQVAHVGDLVLALQGAAGMLWHDDAVDAGFWQDLFLSQWSSRIGGGTEQVQRNIIAERVLGLPREPDPSRHQPWRTSPNGVKPPVVGKEGGP
jgi:alkylation response protein AidB-like acyl-CoA dehydrogenase